MASLDDLIGAAQPQSQSQGATAASLMAGAGMNPDEIAAAHETPQSAPVAPTSKTSRFGTGISDVPMGVAQLAGHVLGQEKISPKELADSGLPPDTKVSFDEAISQREKDYQAGRKAAGSVGFDWMRTAGNVANPINYMIPGGGGATAASRIGGAAIQGGAIAALNPVNEPGNFWGEKLKQGGLGALVGGAVGTGIEAISKPLSWAARQLTGMFKNPEAANAAAQGAIDATLEPTGVKTTDLPPEMVDGLKEQVKHAMDTGGTVDQGALRAQAEAASLPVPIKLPRGQASGDAGQYATEQELAKQIGNGDSLRSLMTENNSKLIANLDAIGAKGAPDAAEAGTKALTTVARIDQALDKAKNAAYNAVKDSSGRSAALDTDHFYVNATDALHENMSTINNSTVRQHLDDIAEGKLPLNVDTMVRLDKAWGRIQRSTADGNEAYGIGLLRRTLNDTPVSGEAGQEAIAAYKQARGLARAQFELADPKSQNFIPGYASMLKGMGNASHDEFISALEGGTSNLDPAKWFDGQVMKATPAASKKLMAFIGQAGDDTPQTIGSAALGSIKDQVLKGNDTVGRAVFSNDAMRKVMDREDTLRQLLPGETVDTLNRLYNTSSRISGVPYKAPVNWSNTSAATANRESMKEAANTVGRAAASLNPVSNAAMGLKDVVSDLSSKRAQRVAAEAATHPLYTVPGKAAPSALKRGAYAAAVPLSSLLASRDETP